jgi:hypothetical protein
MEKTMNSTGVSLMNDKVGLAYLWAAMIQALDQIRLD